MPDGLLRIAAAGILLCAACVRPLLFIARVSDAEVQQPLPGAVVTVGRTEMMAATDSTGSTPAIRARPGDELVFSRPGYLSGRCELPRSPNGRDTLRLELGLYEDLPRVVEGRVLDAGSRTGCSPAVVSVAGIAVQTGPDGSFLIAGFPAGPRELSAACPGYETKAVQVIARAGQTTLVNILLRDTTNEGALDGRVFDASNRAGVGSARCSLSGFSRNVFH